MAKEKKIFMSLTIPLELAKAARIEAAKLNISRSELVRRVIVEYLEKIKKSEDKQ